MGEGCGGDSVGDISVNCSIRVEYSFSFPPWYQSTQL